MSTVVLAVKIAAAFWVCCSLLVGIWFAVVLLIGPATISEDQPDIDNDYTDDLAAWELECAMHRHPAGRALRQRRSE